MGRSPCCDENGLKKGPWTPEEDQKLVKYIQKHGHGSWRALPKHAGLNRCGKSCRLRWTNYLRPDIKRGKFSSEEEQTILNLHAILGNKWSAIATHLPGRTDNEIKNFWNTHLKKKLIQMGFDPMTHRPRTDLFANLPHLMALANLRDIMACHHHYYQQPFEEHAVRFQVEAVQLASAQHLQFMLQSAAEGVNNSSNLNSIADKEAVSLPDLASSTTWPSGVAEGNVMWNSCSLDTSNFALHLPSSNPFIHQSPACSLPNLQIPTQFQQLYDPTTLGCESTLESSFSGRFQQEESALKSPLLLPPLISASHDQTDNSVGTNLVDVSTNTTCIASSFWPDLFLEDPFIYEIV